MKIICNKILFFMVLFFLGSYASFSQNSKSYFSENEFELSFPVATDWSMEIGTGYRRLLQERMEGEKISGSRHEHLELNYFNNYEVNKSLVLSLGLRYRFKELFNDAEADEFRIIEQVGISPENSRFSHRFRLEQRFKEEVLHRVRYELEFSHSISPAFSFGASTEALYAVSTRLKPEAEQRFSIGIENSSIKDIGLGLSLEYRIENYALDPGHEFFIVTGVSLSL